MFFNGFREAVECLYLFYKTRELIKSECLRKSSKLRTQLKTYPTLKFCLSIGFYVFIKVLNRFWQIRPLLRFFRENRFRRLEVANHDGAE